MSYCVVSRGSRRSVTRKSPRSPASPSRSRCPTATSGSKAPRSSGPALRIRLYTYELSNRGTSWETTPAEIAKSISNSLYKRTVVARLDGDPEKLWDLDRPLEGSCKLELLTFDDEQGQMVFWHSSAHVLGEACERRFGCSLCIGPPIESGFYYEMALPDGGSLHESDWKPIENIVSSIVKEKQKFERLEMSKEDLLEMVRSGFGQSGGQMLIVSSSTTTSTSNTSSRTRSLMEPYVLWLPWTGLGLLTGLVHHRLPERPSNRSLPRPARSRYRSY